MAFFGHALDEGAYWESESWHLSLTPLASGWLLPRLHDQLTARALEPDISAVPPAVQLAVPLVLSDKGHQSVEHLRHGAGRLPRPDQGPIGPAVSQC
jgi:hypothetical protein